MILGIIFRWRHINDSAYCDKCIRVWSVSLYENHTITLVHSAEAIGRNEVPFGRDIRVAPSNIVLDGGPMGKGDLGVGSPNCGDQLATTDSKHVY